MVLSKQRQDNSGEKRKVVLGVRNTHTHTILIKVSGTAIIFHTVRAKPYIQNSKFFRAKVKKQPIAFGKVKVNYFSGIVF